MKKAKSLVALLIAALMAFTLVLTACEHQHTFAEEWSSDETSHWHAATCEHTSEVADKADHTWGDDGKCTVCGRDKSQSGTVTTNEPLMELEDYQAYIVDELTALKDRIGSINSTVDSAIKTAYDSAVASINAGKNTSEVLNAYVAGKQAVANCIPLANGIFDYTTLNNAQRTEILGLLEAYGYHTGSTGIPLYGRGGYVIYSDRVTLGSETYIPGYGFGVLAEGSINGDLETEQTAAWKKYYHSYSSQDDGTANYLNSELESVGGTYGYIAASLWTNFMNEEKNGYDWVPELAVGNPVAIDPDANGMAKKWKVELRKDLKYSTLSTATGRQAFNDRPVELEDFITPFKLLLNQNNGYFRGSEMSTQTGISKIPGVAEYYAATEGKGEGILSDDVVDFGQVGISVAEEEGHWYMYYELGQKVTMFNARYYFGSSLYMPIPKEFIDLVGVDCYLGFDSDGLTTPVDNSLSLGAYVLERWDSNQQIVFKKNPNYVYANEKYKIEGVHINILEAAKEDPEAGIKEFEAGRIDACSIPSTKLKDYVGNPLVRTTADDAVFKLNVNALDQETWIELFGENGTVATHPQSDYRTVVPALSNAHFRQALSYALNRAEYSSDLGNIPSANFFSSDYMSDAENGVAYNLTDAHKKAVADLLKGAEDTYGYSLELARDYFRMALDELEATGVYTRGTPSNPTVIKLEIIWQDASQEERDHKYVKQYWENAFNDESVSGGCYKLEISFWAPTDYNETYNRLKAAEYDIGFGSIGGNSLDPLGFMNTVSSDPVISSGWTLNWGVKTNNVDADLLVYNGMRWSFDALYKASQEASIVENGQLVPTISIDDQYNRVADGVEVTVTVSWASVVDDLVVEDFVLFGSNFLATEDYNEFSIFDCIQGEPIKGENSITYKILVKSSDIALFGYSSNQGIDIYLGYSIPEIGFEFPVDCYMSIYYDFVPAA